MIYTEIRYDTVVQIKQGKPILMYLANRGQDSYETSRNGSFNTLKADAIEAFLAWVEHTVLKDGWSVDASVGYAIRHHLFAHDAMVSTKTLYNYVHQGIPQIAPINLPLMVLCSIHKARTRKHKKNLGKSILRREEFRHWGLNTLRCVKKTITSDNGPEFSSITDLESDTL